MRKLPLFIAAYVIVQLIIENIRHVKITYYESIEFQDLCSIEADLIRHFVHLPCLLGLNP